MIIFFKLPPFYSVFMKFRPFRAICLHQKGRSCMILRVRFTFWWSWSVQKLKFFCHFMERSGAKKVNFHYLKNNKSKKTGNWSLDELSGHSCLLKNLSLPLLAPCKQIITEKHFFPCFSKSWRHSADVLYAWPLIGGHAVSRRFPSLRRPLSIKCRSSNIPMGALSLPQFFCVLWWWGGRTEQNTKKFY